jgi:RNA polymerase sigma factor (sigma-70 family)
MNNVVRHLHNAALSDGDELIDGQLLGHFIDHGDETSFAALVQRHGPMVWGVCRRLLDHHDAEDAFQATFLVLFRKAASIRPRQMVSNWLYGVAHKTALQAKRSVTRRSARERQVIEMPEAKAVQEEPCSDLRRLLDQELRRLPDNYRIVVVLCDLEGKTRKEAARHLNLPEGTVGSRLMRARGLLAKLLAKHGLAVSGGALAALLPQTAAFASVSPSVVSSTIKAASLLALGQAVTPGAISLRVAVLTEGVLKTMLLTRLKIALAVVLVFLVVGSAMLAVSIAGSRTAVAEDKKPEGSGANTQKKGDVASVLVRASDVLNLFSGNDAAADEQFTGKQLQVTGNMERIRRYGEKYVLTMVLMVGLGNVRGEILWFEFDATDQECRKQLAALGGFGGGGIVTIQAQSRQNYSRHGR